MNNDWQVLLEIYRGNTAAVEVVRMIHQVSHVWDDLIDKDPATPDDINTAFLNCLIGLGQNPFYRAHCDRIMTVMRLGALNWMAANELEKSPGIPREIAHTARYSIGDIALDIAEIIGGMSWARAHAAKIKLMLVKEPYATFDAEMEAKYGTDQ